MMRTVGRRAFLALPACLASGWLAGPASAAAPILTVRGALDGVAPGASLRFDLQALQAMPQTAFKTSTPWHKQAVTYSGVAIGAFLSSIKARGTKLRLVALNDYSVVADIQELTANRALLAIAKDGVALPISDKGLVFIVFPFDSDARLRTDSVYLHSVWQLSQIEVL